MNDLAQYVVFLRGINVGGHKKVPMAELRQRMEALGFTQVVTILNSGNVIFQATEEDEQVVEATIAQELTSHFGFPIPVMSRRAEAISDLLQRNPFHAIEVTKEIRLYVSFLKTKPSPGLTLPWTSEDGSFRILEAKDRIVCSLLDLSVTTTPEGMNVLEQLFGKDLTTRNWNTLQRIAKKLPI